MNKITSSCFILLVICNLLGYDPEMDMICSKFDGGTNVRVAYWGDLFFQNLGVHLHDCTAS
jgi:hypothetical protein